MYIYIYIYIYIFFEAVIAIMCDYAIIFQNH